MGKLNDIGGTGEWFIGEDKTLELEILDKDGVPVDITGWAITVVLSLTPTSAAIYTKTPATIAGTYSATRASNTQRASVSFTAAESATLVKGVYHWSARRADSGSKTVVAWGTVHIQRTNQA